MHGVRGWVKVHSYTEPRENIVGFDSWILERDGRERRVSLEAGQRQGKHVVAKLAGIDDREQAREWIGTDVLVERDALPPCGPGEYYWVDLEGLEVRNTAGETLGRVERLVTTGANDVIVLRGPGERMIPFAAPVVKEVDRQGGVIVVDWDAAYWQP